MNDGIAIYHHYNSESSEDQLDFHLFLLIEFLHQSLNCLRSGNLPQRLAQPPYLLHLEPSLSEPFALEVVVGQEQGLLELHVSVLNALLVSLQVGQGLEDAVGLGSVALLLLA